MTTSHTVRAPAPRPSRCERSPGHVTVRRAAVIALAALAGAMADSDSARAQVAEAPVRPVRHMAVGNVAFLNSWQPALQAGYLVQPALHRTRIRRGEFGEAEVVPPQWYLHTLAAAGWTSDRDGAGQSGLSSTAQLGIVYLLRDDGPLGLARAGLAAQASLAPRGLGPVGRVEFFHGNAALSVGYMRFRAPRAAGVVVSMDLLRCILHDLGLVGRC
jgi:hypothetical protein